jgi:hypothetical protein
MSEAAIAQGAMESVQSRTNAAPFALTILISAFLLFQVEFIISKCLLPWFGGTAALWTTTMLVFQCLLFAGYAYAHLVSTRLTETSQRVVHLSVVGLSVAGLLIAAVLWPSPLTPGPNWKPQGPYHPVLAVITITLLSTGLPFFCLSATSPLLQSWYARTSDNSPYRLYALSNLGSLIGLFSYPLVIEPLLKLRVQAWVWFALYVVYASGMVVCARGLRTSSPGTISAAETPSSKPTVERRILWLVLSACSSVALLAFTNMMTQYVAAVPLLWAIPLGLYLTSFIICFGAPHWYKRGVFQAAYGVAALAALLAIARGAVRFEVATFGLLLFVACMVCHGELVRLQPCKQRVTSFYLSISAGGALGGFLVGVIAPLVFNRFWEFELSILVAGALAVFSLWRDEGSWMNRASAWVAIPVLAVLVGVPWLAAHFSSAVASELEHLRYFAVAAVASAPAVIGLTVVLLRPQEGRKLKPLQMAVVAFLCVLALGFLRASWGFTGKVISRSRSFYGVLEVEESKGHLILVHGKTIHGAQATSGMYRNVPGTYFAPNSGIGEFLRSHPKRNPVSPMRVGIIGLGVGTLAAYGLPGDYFRFYEIDPAVIDLTRGQQALFSYLDASRATIDVVVGDARLSLEREADSQQAQNFDVLVVDAFSGDAVPVHLLTREAIQIYLRHLAPGGAIAIHISNSALDLAPVLLGITRDTDLYGSLVYVGETSYESLSSTWVLLSPDPSVLNTPVLRELGSALSVGRRPVKWTDDYTNVAPLLRW